MTYHGYELIGKWRFSTEGQIAKGRKDGKLYFLKRYRNPVSPVDNGALDARTFAHNKQLFDAFVHTRTRINAAIRGVSLPGGLIVSPIEEFIEGNQFAEVYEFAESVLSREEAAAVLPGLPAAEQSRLLQNCAEALTGLHGQGLVHGDLRPENILLCREADGGYAARLIDFDKSYFVDEPPAWPGGDIKYWPPELAAFLEEKEEDREPTLQLNEKTDIFSLGLVFHFFLCGSFPEPTALTARLHRRVDLGKMLFCWLALNRGCELQLSPAIADPRLASLIREMLSPAPDDRPTAGEVLRRLREC